MDSECIVKFTERVVCQAASAGECVIVGRGSQHFLKDRPDTLRLFLFSTTEDKVSRGKSDAEALELVDTVDRDRTDFMQKYFHVEWPTRYLYHLMLNTAIGEETVVQTILNFMKTLDAESSTFWSKALH